jgi:hypothetical protein
VISDRVWVGLASIWTGAQAVAKATSRVRVNGAAIFDKRDRFIGPPFELPKIVTFKKVGFKCQRRQPGLVLATLILSK